MKRLFFFPAILLAILLGGAPAQSQEWVSIQEGFRKIQSVKADFLQKRHLPILQAPLLAEGTLFFEASGSLRWEYRKPVPSVMIQKGDAVQVFQLSEGKWKPELIQGIEARRLVLAEIQRWFQGRFVESKVFSHRYLPGPPGRVSLVPREGMDKFISRIEIVFAAKPGVIDRVEIEEPGNSRIAIDFRNVEINSRLPGEIFEKP
jgi:outer membrane lipoprotein-sorting protein